MASLEMKKDDIIPRRREASSKGASRELLMNMMTEEISGVWKKEKEIHQPKASSSSFRKSMARTKSVEDLFYAQMNGEELDASGHDLTIDEVHEESGDDLDLGGSFGCLAIPEMTVPSKMPVDLVSPTKSPSSRSGRRGRGSPPTNRRSSFGSASSHSSSSGVSSGDDRVSIHDIQDYIMNNMPMDIRQKLSQEAWAKVFGKTSQENDSTPPKPALMTHDDDDDEDYENELDDDEDSSVISDITEATGFPKEFIESPPESNRTLKVDETGWDEEVCPGLETSLDTTVHTTDSSGSRGSIFAGVTDSAFSRPVADSTIRKDLKVTFTYVQVRFYQPVLEINPSVSSGPAIGIGWKFRRGGRMLVDDWEGQRVGMIRSGHDLILPRAARETILAEAGYKQKQITEAIRIIRKAKDRRKVTVQNLGTGADVMEETIESAARKFRGILSFGKRKVIM